MMSDPKEKGINCKTEGGMDSTARIYDTYEAGEHTAGSK